ncbi:unnamed protein product [Peniophora sp. CBMAI 1063]|nr:unnamed protein product [Peniophora sp. CBMAI 1063]
MSVRSMPSLPHGLAGSHRCHRSSHILPPDCWARFRSDRVLFLARRFARFQLLLLDNGGTQDEPSPALGRFLSVTFHRFWRHFYVPMVGRVHGDRILKRKLRTEIDLWYWQAYDWLERHVKDLGCDGCQNRTGERCRVRLRWLPPSHSYTG